MQRAKSALQPRHLEELFPAKSAMAADDLNRTSASQKRSKTAGSTFRGFVHTTEDDAKGRKAPKRPRELSELHLKYLKLTNEQADRPRVDFLLRQSKLLGRDDA